MKILLGTRDPQEVPSLEALETAIEKPLKTLIGNQSVILGEARPLKLKLMQVWDLGNKPRGSIEALKVAVRLVVQSPITVSNLRLEKEAEGYRFVVEDIEVPIAFHFDGMLVDRFAIASQGSTLDCERCMVEVDIPAIITKQAVDLAKMTAQSPQDLAKHHPEISKVAAATDTQVASRRKGLAIAWLQQKR